MANISLLCMRASSHEVLKLKIVHDIHAQSEIQSLKHILFFFLNCHFNKAEIIIFNQAIICTLSRISGQNKVYLTKKLT